MLPYLLTGYGLPYTMGYITARDGIPNPEPLPAAGLMDLAAELGLTGVEIPLSSRVPSFEGRWVDLPPPKEGLAEALRRRGLALIADYGILTDTDTDHLLDTLKQAQSLGCKVVRATLSNVLCGDRRTLPEGWPTRLEAVAARLREVLPHAERLGIALALENHQDATTDDLLQLAEMSGASPAFGVTFDTGNPLAMGECPVEAARRLAPLIRHIHLKDYTLHLAPEGYRLVRCAAGEGAVDFPAILKIVFANGHPVQPGIEIAAQATRTIPFLDDGWWSTYPRPSVPRFLGALRVCWAHGRPADLPYSSAWERGEPPAVVIAEELEIVRRSVSYFQQLHPRLGATSNPTPTAG